MRNNFFLNFIISEEVGPNNMFPSRLVDSVEVCPKSKRTTKQMWLSIKGAKISYEAGDYVCVQPKNSEENIQRAAQRLNVNLDANFLIMEKNANSLPLPLMRFKDKTSNVKKILEEFVDLQSFVSPSILRSLAQFTYLPEEKEKLISYSETGGKFSEIKREKKNFIDILNEFPSINLPWLKFLELSPVLNPRYYSIATSSHQTKDLISIVTRRVNYHTPGGKHINGLCSTYLTKLMPKNFNNVEIIDGITEERERSHLIDKLISNSEENELIYMYHKKSTFRLPDDKLVPIIMVAGGCGIAPFIGFIKEREYLLSQGVSLGPAHLFFGCRSEDEMMFRSYILNAVQKGVISGAYLAYSEANPPVLVTDLLGERDDILYPMMEKGHIYMCGAAFANAAFKSFCNIIERSNKVSITQAEQQMKDMILDGRYHEDLQ